MKKTNKEWLRATKTLKKKIPHIYVSMGDLYISRIGPHLFSAAEWADRWWENINHSQTHECGKWD
jgi:hypothetical protein